MPNPGDRMVNKRTGAIATFDGRNWIADSTKQPAMEASMRSRMDIGMAPMVQAQQTMADMEGKGNPFSLSQNPGNALAEVMTNIGIDAGPIHMHPLSGLAKKVGGDDYQAYDQARKSFEAQLMPLMSGAAVSPSEAQRQIRASLPELGDSPTNLTAKDRSRQMMLNGAAKAKNLPLPYPDVPTYGVNTMTVPKAAAPAAGPKGAGPVRVQTPQEAMALPPGTVFVTPDGRRKVR